ncbi:MAG: hypothetical protein K2X55_26595 [Burkholderiaceae bacterium]|nr:hypothetical protein [Burkholderiaceae bacterium]
MSEIQKDPLRVLFCIGVTQNFFDLPESDIGAVWKGYGELLSSMNTLPGVTILGTMDDDRTMVGASASWPWTVYIMADVVDLDTVVAACNLFRTVKVGAYRLWKFGKIEARIGRALIIQGS